MGRSKDHTDKSYNTSISNVLSTVSAQLKEDPKHALSIVFGTHNPESVDLILDGLKSNGLVSEGPEGRLKMREDVRGRIGIAQLYGEESCVQYEPMERALTERE